MGRFIGSLFSGLVGVFSGDPNPTVAPSVSPTPVPIVATTLPPASQSNVVVGEESSVQEQHEDRCIFEMSLGCLTCNEPPPVCTARPTELAFRYTGASCGDSRNAQQDSSHPHVNYFCLDFNDSEDEEWEEVYAIITGLKDNIKRFEGWVKQGDVLEITNGGDSLVPDHMIKVFRDENIRAPNSIVQAVQYHTSCAMGTMSIGDAFGAFSVMSFTNEDQGRVSPMRNQTMEITLSTQYDDLGDVESLEANLEMPPLHFNIPEPVGARISAFRNLVQWFEVPTDLSTRNTYELTAHMAMFNKNSKNSCVGETATRFIVGGVVDPPTEAPTAPPTNAPTDSPTDSPTAAPTDSPTSPPTDAPTAPPTDTPTTPPTDAPTGPPTDAPTDSPTHAPTDSPTDAPTAMPSDTPTVPPTEAPTVPLSTTMPSFYDEEVEPATEPTPVPSTTMPPYYYGKALEPTPSPSETWNPYYYNETKGPTIPPFYYSRPAPTYMYHTEAPYTHEYPTHWKDNEYPYNPDLCMLSTEVECTTSAGDSCHDYKLSFPTSPVCLDRGGAIELEFMLTGFSCHYHGGFGHGEFDHGHYEKEYETDCWDVYEEENRIYYEMQVFVQIFDHGGELFYKKVTLGDTFRLRGPFKSEHLSVVISAARDGYREELQVMEGLYIGCSGDWSDLTMNRDYGALQLVGFTTPSQGRQSMVETFTYTTTIWNQGSDTVKLTSAQAYVYHLPQPINVTDCPIGLGPGAAITAKTNVSINMAAVMGRGFGVDVFTSAQGQENTYCSDSAHAFVDVPYVETPPPKTLAPTGLPTCYHVPSPTQENDASGGEGQGQVDDIREIVRPVAYHRGREWYSESYQASAIKWLEEDEYSYGLSAERIQQRYALACIYFATYAVQTIHTVVEPRGWIESTGWVGEGSECEWFGVTCDSNFMVESITLASNRLTGSFPVEAGILASSLKKLDLFRNPVYNSGREGHEFLAQLYNLETLYYGQTKFEYIGLPPHIARLTNLVEYDCSHTLYSGPIDGWIFEGLQNLDYLVLSGNTFNSSIPEEIYFLENLQFFYAQDAALTGDLSFMYALPSIVELWVDRNPGLGGTISPWIEEIHTLQSLSISDCALTGTIPAEIGSLRNMIRLWLHGNSLFGTIPTELGNLFKLQTLELQGNFLSGVMPQDVCMNVVPQGFLQTVEVDCGQVSCDCCTNCPFAGEVKQSQAIFDKPISYWP